MQKARKAILTRDGFDAVIFDFDGVVADKASIHVRAWKTMFDVFLSMDEKADGEKLGHVLSPFDPMDDYLRYVDGKLRIDGVRDFLRSRNIILPEGSDKDPLGLKTLYGLGNWKNRLFQKYIKEEGVKIAEPLAGILHDMKRHGIRSAVISVSKNCTAILDRVGFTERFDAKVDGLDTKRLGIPGKPDAGIFLEAAARLGVEPLRSAVIVDSLAGVEAAKAGGFGLVVGLAGGGKQAELLYGGGADIVIADLSELAVKESSPLQELAADTLPSVKP